MRRDGAEHGTAAPHAMHRDRVEHGTAAPHAMHRDRATINHRTACDAQGPFGARAAPEELHSMRKDGYKK